MNPSEAEPKAHKLGNLLAGTTILDETRTRWDNIVESYLSHKRSGHHPTDLMEWLVMEKILLELTDGKMIGKRVVDVGTGTAYVVNKFKSNKNLDDFESMMAFDLSGGMLREATSQIQDDRVMFYQADAAELTVQKGSIDLAVSVNVLDCVADLPRALANIYAALKSGGEFIFSIRHPERDALYATGDKNGDFEEGPYEESWPGTDGKTVIRFYRKIGTWIQLLETAGFNIKEMKKPDPSPELKNIDLQMYQEYLDRPGALVFRVRKNGRKAA